MSWSSVRKQTLNWEGPTVAYKRPKNSTAYSLHNGGAARPRADRRNQSPPEPQDPGPFINASLSTTNTTTCAPTLSIMLFQSNQEGSQQNRLDLERADHRGYTIFSDVIGGYSTK